MGEKESDCVASRCVLSPAACSLNECGAFVFLPILECLGAVCVTSKLHYHGPRNTAVRCGAVGPRFQSHGLRGITAEGIAARHL